MLAEMAKPPCPSPLPSALRARDARTVAGIFRQPLAHFPDDFALRAFALLGRQRLEVEMEMRRRAAAAAAAGRAAAAGIDDRFDLGDAVDALQVLQHAEGELLRPLERGAFGRVHVHRPLAHVLVGHEVAADHPVQRERQQERDDRDAR